MIESLRHVLGLEPLGKEARASHEGILRNVLRSGTKVSLLVRCHRPGPREYRIERTIPNPTVVRDAKTGDVLNVTASDVFRGVEVYGQHEISELARSPGKLTRLLGRFVERDDSAVTRKREVRRELERSRSRLLAARKELDDIEERLDALPGLEETLKRYQDAGLEEDLKEQSLLVREERVLDTIPERLRPFRSCLDELRQELPIDRIFLSPKALEDLPGKGILAGADQVLDELNAELERILQAFDAALSTADRGIRGVHEQFEARRAAVQAAYEKKLRELQKSRIDGEEFIGLRRRIEELRPLKERQSALNRAEAEHLERRRSLLVEWEEVKAEEFRALARAGKHRDYLLSDSDIELSIYSNRLEIVSPGRLANGITPERMRIGCRSARNELLKDVMRDYGYLEHMGMGVPWKIVRGMKEHNGTEPELIEEDERCTIRLWKEVPV